MDDIYVLFVALLNKKKKNVLFVALLIQKKNVLFVALSSMIFVQDP